MKGNKNKVRKFTPIRDSQKKETPSNKDKEKKRFDMLQVQEAKAYQI